jgi:TonB-linked SusC/RagA family outer membrane protein
MSGYKPIPTLGTLLAAAVIGSASAFAEPAEAVSEAPAAATATASQGVCRGQVLDENGEPLIGASVKVVGSKLGVSTDIDGYFTLGSIKVGSTIEISYIGFHSQRLRWDGHTMNVVLKENTTVLDEVVVMGYGVTQKRAKVTNSISKVTDDVLTIGANANPAQALAGAVSGLKVYVQSGDPAATPTIILRGGNNYDGSGSPLIVVDGQVRSSLEDINPNDIESMDVLKDAGATALYGARAAGGVILITTKKGKSGTRQINFNAKWGVSFYDNGYDYVDVPGYLKWYRTAATNTPWFSLDLDSSNTPFGIGRTEITADMEYNIMSVTDNNRYLLDKGWQSMYDPIDPTREIMYRDSNLMDYNLNLNPVTQDYNVSMSGGNDRGTYYAGLGYYDAEGALYTSYYKRYTFSFTGSYNVTNWLTSNSTFNYQRANWIYGPGNIGLYDGTSYDFDGYLFGRTAAFPRTVRITDEDGNYLYGAKDNGGVANNFRLNADKFLQDYQSDKFAMSTGLTAKLFKGMTLKGTMNWYYDDYVGETGVHDYQLNQAATSWYTTRWASSVFTRTFTQTYNLVAAYQNTFNDVHSVSAMVGAEYYDKYYRSISASGAGAETDDFLNLQYTSTDDRSISNYHYKERIASLFGRFEYDYKEKYLLAATFRDDGYSRLVNNRWGFFPGVSGGWVFSKEDFFNKLVPENVLNFGKIRASFGESGYVNSSYIGYYNLQGAYSSYQYADSKGFRLSSLANPNLRWEKTRTFEVGLDLGFMKNRINFAATYYNRLNDDKVASLSLPQTTGFSSVTYNNGSYRNRGVEFDITAHIFNTRDLQWSVTANLAYNKNLITKLPDNGLLNNRQNGTEAYVGRDAWHYETDANGVSSLVWDTQYLGGYQEGQEPGCIIGYKVDHIIRDQSQVPEDYIDITSTKQIYSDEAGRQRLLALGYSESNMVQLAPGDIVFYDVNGDGTIDSKDVMNLGSTRAHWTGGFNTTLRWKAFQLYARFDMGFDFTVYDSNLAYSLGCGQGTHSMMTQVEDTWTPTNPDAKYPRYTYSSQLGTNNWIRTSSLMTQDGTYLACRELQLSYNMPKSLCQRFYCQGLQVSVTGQNLGYIKSCTIPLPDRVSYTTGNTAGAGGTYNLSRTVLFGLNLTF